MRKSYSVNDLSLDSSADFVDNRDQIEDSDDEQDNRLIAERFNHELAEMAAAGSRTHPRPALNQGNMRLGFCVCTRY